MPARSKYYRMGAPAAILRRPCRMRWLTSRGASMRPSTVRRFLAWVIAVAAAACIGDKMQAVDATGDSSTLSASLPPDSVTTTNAAASRPDSARATISASPPRPARAPIPDSHASIPACRRPVAVTYYARGGVPDEFIVTFGRMNGAPADAVIDTLARRHGFTPRHRYQGAFSGFSARLPVGTLAAIRCEPAVTGISQVVAGTPGTAPPIASAPHAAE